MLFGSCGGRYHQDVIGCCITPGTIGYFQGKATSDFECKVVNDAYSQCVPADATAAATAAAVRSSPPADKKGTPCQQKPYGGCGGTHKSESGCCVAAGTKGYEHIDGKPFQTDQWMCRAHKGRDYSQCLPTFVAPAPRSVTIDPAKAAKAPVLKAPAAKAVECQVKPYGACDREFVGCCIPEGTAGWSEGKKAYAFTCKSWKGHKYKQCLPEA